MCSFVISFPSFVYGQVTIQLNDGVVENVLPGQVVVATIVVKNTGETNFGLKFYLADFERGLDFVRYPQPDSTIRSNASWIKLGATEIIVPSYTTKEIPVEIVVPNNLELSGSYWSMIMAEPLNQNVGQLENQFNIVKRRGLNVVTTFKKGFVDLKFRNPNMSNSESNSPIFEIDIENIGSSIAKTDIYLDIFTQQGETLGRLDIGRRDFRPENPIRIDFNLSEFAVDLGFDLSQGTYTALLVIDAGEDNLFGARYNINFQ